MDKQKIDRAVYKKTHKSKFKIWWYKNGYKVLRVVLFYIWIPTWLYELYANKKAKSFVENPEKTKKMLDKAFPKIIAYNKTDASLILISIGYDYDSYCDFSYSDFRDYPLPKRVRNYFHRLNEEQIENAIINYEIAGYEKVYLQSAKDWEKAKEHFDWGVDNYYRESAKAILFYDKNKYGNFVYD